MISQTEQYLKHAHRILKQNKQESAIKIRSLLNNGIGFYILSFDAISSTMLLSQKWDKKYVKDKIVFIFTAKQQSSGKGQRNNQWSSPEGNIYMTVLTKQTFQVIPYIFMAVSVSIAEIIHDTFNLKEGIRIKWVNDLVLGDRKIGGILVKSDIFGDSIYLQIGIGINIKNKPIQISGCLAQYMQQHKEMNKDQFDQMIEKLALGVIRHLEGIPTESKTLVEKYDQRLAFKNEYVKIYDGQLKNVLKTGKFIGVNEYGFAILQSQDGSKFQVSDGRMRKQ